MLFLFQKKLFLFLTFAFIAFTVIGTLSHEFGHYIVAKSFGYNSKINYASNSWRDTKNKTFTDSVFENHLAELKAGKDFPGKEKFLAISKKHKEDSFWITLGGPVQTIFTGTLGLICLFIFGKNYNKQDTLKVSQWLLIFISLFWLRELANFVTYIGKYFLSGEFSKRGDEIQLALHLGLPHWSVISVMAFLGGIVLTIVVFKFIPPRQRFTFIVSGIVGGILGYLFWLEWLGPVIMP